MNLGCFGRSLAHSQPAKMSSCMLLAVIQIQSTESPYQTNEDSQSRSWDCGLRPAGGALVSWADVQVLVCCTGQALVRLFVHVVNML
jgi:hypothetical protein